MPPHSVIRRSGHAAMLGSALFSIVIVALTLLEREHMAGLGWHPLRAPTMDWPSGLALGPLGLVMTAAFIGSGALLLVFARGAGAWFNSRAASAGFAVAGIGMAALAFPTDPTLTTVTATWHGRLHDLAYVILGAGLAAGLIACIAAMRHAHPALAAFSAFVLIAAVAGFALKGFLFYLMVASVMSWLWLIGRRMRAATPT